MKHGKREMPRQRRNHKGLMALVALVLIICCTAGGTVAWLATSSGPVTNTFTPTHVTTEVHETFGNRVKSNVKIKNTGDIDAYIRAAIVVNWADDSGNVYGKNPVVGEDKDYTLSTGSGWTKGSDGFYYYNGKVAAGGFTTPLITTCEQKGTAPADGYALQVTILADGIQADGQNSSGTPAVETVWPVTVNSNKTLSVNNS